MRSDSRLLSSIGNNPIVKLTAIVPEDCAEVVCWITSTSGSVKDRTLVHGGRRRNVVSFTGDRIVEATSGNTGIAFAMIGP